jgi:serine/threonine protein kinase
VVIRHVHTFQVAIKIIEKSPLPSFDHRAVEREIAVMKSLHHPFIVRLLEVGDLVRTIDRLFKIDVGNGIDSPRLSRH